MFLTELNLNDRKDFLDLAFYAMGLNGEHKEDEIEVFGAFVHECELQEYEPENQENIKVSIKKLSKKGVKVKKIVLIELLGILLADGEICDAEAEFLDVLGHKFEFEPYEVKRIQRWVENMNDLVAEGYRMLEID